MGIPTRHSGYPYEDGETLNGSDLETDVANLYTEIANIEDANVAAAADIDGSKLKDATITNAKMTASTITTAKMNQSAVSQAYVSSASATTAVAMTTATTLQDVAGITDATITPGAVGDYILCDFSVIFGATGTLDAGYDFAFSVDGTDTSDTGYAYIDPSASEVYTQANAQWGVTATATSAHVIKPRYKAYDNTMNAGKFAPNYVRVFRVQVIPQK
jgi:hypothetical protein